MKTLTDHALQILENRYFRTDPNGLAIETTETMFARVAGHIARAEAKWGSEKEVRNWENRFYQLMTDLDFLPNSPTLMNAGVDSGQLSACFVLPVEDNLESIFTTLKNTALIHQSGGGTGFNFSKLRPKGDRIDRGGGNSSGPVSFIRIFDRATEEIRQGGKRRGANMAVLNADHPDIVTFINSKVEGTELRNFNISVAASDHFMKAVRKNADWPLINPRTGVIFRSFKARELWHAIIRGAWHSGDPGLIFLDAINKYNPTPVIGIIQATNPCGEMPLLDYESCNLGSLNLANMVKMKGRSGSIDWGKIGETISVAIRFLDDVIEMNTFPLQEIADITLANRKIGLGVMGWAAMLIRLGIPYDSEEAVLLAGRLMKFITSKSRDVSADLAIRRGPFPNWSKSIYAKGVPMRNATCTSIAPTGTISTIAGTTFSIEPLFALAYTRKGILDDRTQSGIDPFFLEKMQKRGLWNDNMLNQVSETGTLAGATGVPEDLRYLFKTALEMPWNIHLRHQLAFQQYTDNAVSKTINLPEEATEEDVSNIYMEAWQSGAKGITVYRWGSKEEQVFYRGCNKANC